MNELDKLIEQYRRENPEEYLAGKFKICRLLEDGTYDDAFSKSFVKWMYDKLASRPTCGQEQRKFLDEVEARAFTSKQGEISVNGVNLDDLEFAADLQKVIQGE